MTSSMNKILIIITLLLSCIWVNAQDVKYYQLIRKEKNGVSDKNVSGGLFITFVGSMCFESDKSGVGINHGTMQRSDNYSNAKVTVYDGSKFWGQYTAFKFNSDKTGLNVIFDDGEIYIYKQSSPPEGVITCSLIRKKENDSSSGYSPHSSYPVQQDPSQGYPKAEANTSNMNNFEPSSSQRRYVKYYEDCFYCHGNGTVVLEQSVVTFNLEKRYCNICGESYWSDHTHSHVTCKYCKGKGQIEKIRYE